MSHDKLAKFLKEVATWRWDDFVKAEKDKQYTSNEAIIFALVRACAMRNLTAIKVAINRLDGKLKTPVRIEMPKVFYLYPNAKAPLLQPDDHGPNPLLDTPDDASPKPVKPLTGDIIQATEPTAEGEPKDLPSMGFREVLAEMSDYPRDVPEMITAYALQAEQWLREQAPEPENIPMVKSVVAAHLLIMAQSRNMDAIGEVFDSIDGKLVETLQVLGEDIYINIYSEHAPDGAIPNADGVLQIEATQAQEQWAQKLGRDSHA